MKKVTGYIKTNKVGSMTGFEFEVEDDCSDDEIAEMAKEAAFDCVEWNYTVEATK